MYLRLTTCASLIIGALSTPAGALAGEPAWTNVNAFVTPADFSAGCAGFSWIDDGDCASLTGPPVTGDAFLWIVASGSDGFDPDNPASPNGVAAIEFGITHDLDISSWTLCTGGLEIPMQNWPASGSGNAVTWNGCYMPGGNNARIGYFYLQDGSTGHLAVRDHVKVGGVNMVDCDAFTYPICDEQWGSIDLSVGSVPTCVSGGGTEAPSNVSATATGCDVALEWEHSGDDVDSFEVRRDDALIASLPANARAFVDSPVPVGGETYTYEVAAATSCSRLPAPPLDVATEATLDAPSDVNASAVPCFITLTWAHDGFGVIGFQILRDGNLLAAPGAGARSFVDTGIPFTGATYAYEVYAVSACELVGAPPVMVASATLEAASDCQATTGLCQHVQVTWTDNSEGESGFKVLRDGEVIAEVDTDVTAYDDTNVSAGPHDYVIHATSPCGDAPPSNTAIGEASVLIAASDCAATTDLCDRVDLSWVDNSEGEIGFDVLRSGSVIMRVGPDVTTFSDTTAEPGVAYSYHVVVVDTCGPGEPSNNATGRRETAPSVAPDVTASAGLCLVVRVRWTDSAPNETEQRVYRDGALIATLPADTNAYDDTDAIPGLEHDYVVELANACGAIQSPEVAGSATDDPPPVPTGLDATDGFCYAVFLDWTDESLDEHGFRIWRDGGELAVVASDVTSYADSSATPGVPYTYTVSAFNDCGDSGPSNTAIGVRIADAEPVPAPALLEPQPGAECIGNPVAFLWESDPAAVLYEIEILRGCNLPPLFTQTTTAIPLVLDLPLGQLFWRVRGLNGCEEWGEWSECRAVSAAPEIEAPGFIDAYRAGGEYFVNWAPVENAERYELAMGSYTESECFDYGAGTQLFSVAGTDTTLAVSEVGDLHFAWVRAIACDTYGEPSFCVEVGIPVPVVLEYFELVAHPGEVLARWATRSEEGMRGFHLYRTSDGEPRHRVTAAPIPSGAHVYQYTDGEVMAGKTYTYALVAAGEGDGEAPLAEATLRVPAPASVLTLRARPNPFNPRVTLTLEVPVAGPVRLEVLDASGRAVRTLLTGERPAGTSRAVWDGTDAAGRRVASGVYFVRAEAGGQTRVERITLLK